MTDSPASEKPATNGRHDVWSFRLVVLFLGAAALLSGGGIVGLALHGSDAPSALVAFGSASLGSLATMLNLILKQPD